MTNRRVSWNAALWIAAVPVALTALRIMMFSRGDPALLRVLLQTLQVLPVLVATTVQLFPWIVLMVGFILLANASARRAVSPWLMQSRVLIVAAILCVCVVLYVSPPALAVPMLVVYLALLALYVLGRVPKQWAKKTVAFANKLDNGDPLSAVLGSLIFPLVLLQFANWNSFWLPREAVTVSNEVVDAYVLDVTGEWTTLLTSEREVLRFRTESVTSRAVCDQGEANTFMMLGAEPLEEPSGCSR